MTLFRYSQNKKDDTEILVNGESIVCSFATDDRDYPTEKIYFMGLQ